MCPPLDTDKTNNTTRPRPPVPSSVSAEAQDALAMAPFAAPPFPAINDTQAWVAYIDMLNGIVETEFVKAMPPEDALARTLLDCAGVPTYELTPPTALDATCGDFPLFLDFHGGGLILGGGPLAWRESIPHAQARAGVTWAPDYRMPPTHPFPAALDDALAVYRAALGSRPSAQIVVSGSSAGGNLAAALLVRARDEGLPMPACLVLHSPHVDLTESGDTFNTNLGVDSALTVSLMPANLLYANGADLRHPYISPLFADLQGLPPTFLQSGTRDVFLSNTVRMHRRLLSAGVNAELHVFEAMPHVAFTGSTPEDEEVRQAVRRFEERHLAQK